MSNNEEMVEIYRIAGEIEAQVIRGLLESNDIPCLLKSNAAFSAHMFAIDGMGEVKVMVLESIANKAKRLIEGKDYV
ncbi:MAG TPA: DUF2007 domain-containing protein [Dehalococcoidia bacterium]|nr:DUF2007 domain-containing protein [Dehalococcoidia bacterium]